MNYSFHMTILEVYGVLYNWDNYITDIQSQVKMEFQWTRKQMTFLDWTLYFHKGSIPYDQF